MIRRDFGGGRDLAAMQRAVQRVWTPGARWHVGDLAWQWHSVGEVAADPRTSLWTGRDGEVVAWGRISGDAELDLFGEAAEVLAWFDEVAGLGAEITVMDAEAEVGVILEKAGYRVAEGAPFFEHCLLALDDSLPAPSLPDGYRVRALRGEDEAAARAAVHRAAWRPGRVGKLLVPPVDLGEGESRVTTERYRSVMGAWPYRTDLDLVVEAPDGSFAAFALGWFDEVNRVGELEPVGTDPRHARQGLAAAVSLACLRAMRAAGAERAVVNPRGDDAYPVPGRLYRGLGFRPVARTVTYARHAQHGGRLADQAA